MNSVAERPHGMSQGKAKTLLSACLCNLGRLENRKQTADLSIVVLQVPCNKVRIAEEGQPRDWRGGAAGSKQALGSCYSVKLPLALVTCVWVKVEGTFLT